jgi:hypothetical protein
LESTIKIRGALHPRSLKDGSSVLQAIRLLASLNEEVVVHVEEGVASVAFEVPVSVASAVDKEEWKI